LTKTNEPDDPSARQPHGFGFPAGAATRFAPGVEGNGVRFFSLAPNLPSAGNEVQFGAVDGSAAPESVNACPNFIDQPGPAPIAAPTTDP
jgi:hypothetical protein